MQKNKRLVNQFASLMGPYIGQISDKKINEFEWFLKLEAVNALNQENKDEFNSILENNDMDRFALFLIKYVAEIDKKIINFLKEN